MIVTNVTVRVPAKINLQLAVGPLRPDGYHGLVTVFQAISLCDEVTVAVRPENIAIAEEGFSGTVETVVYVNGKAAMTRTVRSVEHAPLPPDTFDIPAGYTRKEMPGFAH